MSHLLENETEKAGKTGRAWSEVILVCEVGDILGGTETMLSREAIADLELEDALDTQKKTRVIDPLSGSDKLVGINKDNCQLLLTQTGFYLTRFSLQI